MHEFFPGWYLLADPSPTHDGLEKRWQGVEAFAEALSKSPNTTTAGVARLCLESPGDVEWDWPGVQTMRSAFQTADAAFPMRNNDMELRVLAGASLFRLMDHYDPDAASTAALAVSCAHCRGQGSTLLNRDLLSHARRTLNQASSQVRLPWPSTAVKVAPAHGKLAEGLKEIQAVGKSGAAPDATFATEVAAHFERVHKAIGQLTSNISAANEKMLGNQDILQEETNILWWLFGERSRDLDKPMSDVGARAVCLIAAKELADLTRFVPGHFAARSFLSRSLDRAKGKAKAPTAFALAEVVAEATPEWRRKWMQKADLPSKGPLLPVLSAVAASLEAEGEAWQGVWKTSTRLKQDISLPPLDLAEQVFEECLLLRSIKS